MGKGSPFCFEPVIWVSHTEVPATVFAHGTSGMGLRSDIVLGMRVPHHTLLHSTVANGTHKAEQQRPCPQDCLGTAASDRREVAGSRR